MQNIEHFAEPLGSKDENINTNKPFAKLEFDEAEEITFYNIFGEHNYRSCSIFNMISYISMLIGLAFQFLFLASDIYTLVQIYALNNWDNGHTITYIPILAYKIIFTTCIGISFVYFIFFWILGIFIERKEKVVGTYLHSGARTIDSLKSYERFCVFEKIQTKNFHDWMCLTIYTAYHYDIVSWILADTPRQALNGATIAYIVSNKFTSGDISGVINSIAQNNKQEAVLLSFMFFSFIVWLCFTFKNVIVIISSICVITSTKRKFHMKFSKYCANLVAQSVSNLYSEKAQLQEENFSKRRKVPSFLKDSGAISDIENEISMDDTISNFNDNYSNYDYDYDYNYNNNNNINNYDYSTDINDSIDKSNPFNIELHQIPTSHSRTNLINNQTSSSLHLDNITNSITDDNDDPFNTSNAELLNNIEYNDDDSHNDTLNNYKNNNHLYGSRRLAS